MEMDYAGLGIQYRYAGEGKLNTCKLYNWYNLFLTLGGVLRV